MVNSPLALKARALFYVYVPCSPFLQLGLPLKWPRLKTALLSSKRPSAKDFRLKGDAWRDAVRQLL